VRVTLYHYLNISVFNDIFFYIVLRFDCGLHLPSNTVIKYGNEYMNNNKNEI
jgi:hypothetical protein